MSTKIRRRRSPETARAEAVAAARDILLEQGPAAITLKAVAGRLGMTHANLLHHFGSAGELQSALMTSMVADLAQALEAAIASVSDGTAERGALVDIVFDAFAAGGAARLAAWLSLNDDTRLLAPVGPLVLDLVAALMAPFPQLDAAAEGEVRRLVLAVAYQAFAEALIGPSLRPILGLTREDAINLTKAQVVSLHPLEPRC